MTDFFNNLIVNTLLAAVLAGVSCGIIGVFISQMNLSSLGFCMSHAAFAGAALGLALHISPLLFSLLFSILTAAILGPIADKSKLHANVVMGIMFPLYMALGLVFLNLNPTSAMTSTALSLLWGSILGVGRMGVIRLVILTLVLITTVILFEKEFLAIMLSRKLAKASGIRVEFLYYLVLFLTGITVALSLRLIGGLLIFTLMINPASSAYQFFYDIKKVLLSSPLLAAASALLGMLVSFQFNLPIGSSIAIVSTLGFAFSVIVSPKRRKG